MISTKFLKNKDSGNALVPVVLMMCIFILLVDSVAISWFTTQWYGSSSITPLVLPDNPSNYNNNQNFASCSYNKDTWYITGNAQWSNQCDVANSSTGEVLTEPNTDSIFWYSWLLIRNILPDTRGQIINNYQIINPSGKPYVIALRYTGSTDQNEIRVDTDGFHIPNYVIPPFGITGAIAFSDQIFIPSSNPAALPNVNIQTVYNNNDNSLKLTFNNAVYTATNLKSDSNILGIFGRYFGGVGSNSQGFTVVSLNTANSVANPSNNDWLGQIATFITSLFSMLVFGVPSTLLPVEIGFIAIRLPEIGILICVVIILLDVV